MKQKINGNNFFIKYPKVFSIFLIFILLANFSLGATLSVDNQKVRVGVPIKIIVKFTNEKKQDYKINGIENFQSINRSSQESSSWINGKSSRTYSDIYSVLPLNEGDFTLSLEVGGKKVSDDININVSKDNKTLTNELVTIKTSEYKREYYQWEKIPYFEKLIIKTSLRNYGYMNQPVFNNFSFKDTTPISSQGNHLVKKISDENGERLEILTKEGILDASTPGEEVITSGLISYTESTGNDFFMIDTSTPKYTGGNEVSIKILPLSEENKPNNFKNVVGDLKGNINWEQKSNVEVGQSYMLKLKLYGDVNLDFLEKLPIEMNEDFNIYQSVSDFSEKIINGKYQASKEFEIAFIPKKPGVLTIPAIEIPFFDVNSRSYKTFVIDKKEIKAFGGENIKTTSNVVPLNKSIGNNQPVQPKEKINITVLPEENESFDFKFLYLIIGGLLLIVLVEGGIILKLIYDKKSSKKSYKNFFKDMKVSKDNKEFYEVYCNFMKEKYNFSPKAQFEDILVKNGGSDEILMINRYIHESLFKNEQIDIIKVIKTLKAK